MNTFVQRYAATYSKLTQKLNKSVSLYKFFQMTTEKLTPEQRQQIARALYEHVSVIIPFQAQILEAFAEKFQTTVKYSREIIKGRRPLQPIHANWLIEQTWGMVSVRFIRETFWEIANGSPEKFGYFPPVYEVLPEDITPTEKSVFERWKSGELVKKQEPETV